MGDSKTTKPKMLEEPYLIDCPDCGREMRRYTHLLIKRCPCGASIHFDGSTGKGYKIIKS